jgi:predicted acyl esterase
LQRRFFDFYLKGEANDWAQQPKVQLQVRRIDGIVKRHETDWPLPATVWTRFYLDPREQTLSLQPPAEDAEISFAAMGDGLTFISRPLTEDTEITGPLAVDLRISSSTKDADIFVVFRVFSSDLREYFCGCDRSAHARGAGLAARLTSQARRDFVSTSPSLPRP